MYRLYEQLAPRYDLHTPSEHYHDDRAFVLDVARARGERCRMLDVGCGTGMLVAAARAIGIDAVGIDAATGMVGVATERLGPGFIERRRMQDIDAEAAFDVVTALAWTLNYCASADELGDVLRRIYRALRPGGQLVAQLAHAPNATGALFEDREPGPDGAPDDVVFYYRFTAASEGQPAIQADYVYVCRSLHELAFETHILRAADARAAAETARSIGFVDVQLFDSYRRDPLHASASPWLVGQKPAASSPGINHE